MEDKVKELAWELVKIIDAPEGWQSAEQKLGYIKAYLLGLQDGIDYLEERMQTTSRVILKDPEKPRPKIKIRELLYTCTQCGCKTGQPVFIADACAPYMDSEGVHLLRRPYCEACAKKLNPLGGSNAGNKG